MDTDIIPSERAMPQGRMTHRRLKVSEYAEREGVSIRTVRRWIEKGAIDVVRVGPSARIRIIA
jgi:excisionase family DNA binding protein